MSKLTQYLKAAAIALLIPFSAHAQKAKTAKDTDKSKIAELTKRAGKYSLWDDRKPTDYDATKDFLKYPIKVNYTVDSLMYAYEKMPLAYLQEGVILNYIRENPENFPKNVPSILVHEVLHFVQAEKMAHLEKQPEFKGVTFLQQYELEMCREVASHIADKLADKLASGKPVDIIDIAKIANQEAQDYLKHEARTSDYLEQFFSVARNHFNPDVTEEDGHDMYMKMKAAIMTQYIVVDGQVKSINLLPLLTDASLDLIKPTDAAKKQYAAEKEATDEGRRCGFYHGGINDKQKLKIMAKRFRLHMDKWEKDDLFKKGCRSSGLSMDVSSFFPSMTSAQFKQTEKLIKVMAQNETAGKHNENQTALTTFLTAKDKTTVNLNSFIAAKTVVKE